MCKEMFEATSSSATATGKGIVVDATFADESAPASASLGENFGRGSRSRAPRHRQRRTRPSNQANEDHNGVVGRSANAENGTGKGVAVSSDVAANSGGASAGERLPQGINKWPCGSMAKSLDSVVGSDEREQQQQPQQHQQHQQHQQQQVAAAQSEQQQQRQQQHGEPLSLTLPMSPLKCPSRAKLGVSRGVPRWIWKRSWLRLSRRRPRPSNSPAVSPSFASEAALPKAWGLRQRRSESSSLPLARRDARLSWPRWRWMPTSNKTSRAFKVVMLIVAVFVLCGLFEEAFIRTYCFQVRAMQRAQIPRGECPIVRLTRLSRTGVSAVRKSSGMHEGGSGSRGSGGSGGLGRTSEEVEEKLRFGIILMSDEGMWPRRYTEMGIANKHAYAAFHGYDVIIASDADVDRSRPAAWSKLLVLRKHIDDYDYVIFVDIDAFIMNPEFKLEWILDVARKQQQTGGFDGWGDPHREPHLIVTQDWNGPNSGLIMIKNSDFSRWLLKEWWDQDQFVHGSFPYQFEQRAMHYLMQPDSWRNRGLPYYADHKVIRDHTAVVDQCVMNSYLVHPWQEILGRTQDFGPSASYVPGDFILHFAGKKGRVRLQLVDYYYPQAVKAFEKYEERRRLGLPERPWPSPAKKQESSSRGGGLRGRRDS